MSVLKIDVRGIGAPDAVTVDVLARVHCALKRCGYEMRLTGACDQLRELIAFMGLDDVLIVEPRR